MAKVSKNILGALGIGILAIVYLSAAFQLPFGSAKAPGDGFVPVLMGSGLLALCICLIGIELFFPTTNDNQIDLWEEDEEEGESTGLKKPLLITIALLIYPVALVYLGFIISTTALIFMSLRVMEYRNWQMSLVVAIISTLVSYFVFSSWLSIYFPAGILG